jgi:nucleoside-diphosphate-sugar epimerase
LKVLLTGATGFVGSHILDKLRAHRLPTVLLLRSTSDTQFVKAHLTDAEIRSGSINDLPSLLKAMVGITHVIHCAGRTKALRISEFYETNHLGTGNLVKALNHNAPEIQRLVHISSLAASGPATPSKPAVEDAEPHPVSDYGKSKLAAEVEIREHCQTPFTIIRPPAVYGPRDTGFLSLFRAVRNHLLPRPNKTQELSLVYVRDLAENIIACLLNPKTAGRTYFIASPEVVTGSRIAEEIAAQMKRWTISFPIPSIMLWMVCLLQQSISQVTRQARLLNLQKYAELRAPGWVCSPLKLKQETGLICATDLSQGIAETLEWYTREHWL